MIAKIKEFILKRPLLMFWAVVALVLYLMIQLFSPEDAEVIRYKVELVVFGGIVAYWIDRAMFPYARPDQCVKDYYCDTDWQIGEAIVFAAAMIRRALIVVAAMLSMAYGL